MDVTGTFDVNAPAGNVYSNLTDLERAERWLPSGARLDVTVAGPNGGVYEATVRRALDRVMADLRRDVDDSFTPG